LDGEVDGLWLGEAEGDDDGLPEGLVLGVLEGEDEGLRDGEELGEVEGELEGELLPAALATKVIVPSLVKV
jgi:hypothetical protein